MVGAVHSIPVGNTVGNTSPGVARFLNYEKAGPWGDEEGGAGVSLRGDEWPPADPMSPTDIHCIPLGCL